MQISFSTTGIFDPDKPMKYINYISDAGFNSVMLDLSIFCSKYDLEDYGKEQGHIKEKKNINVRRMQEQAERFLKLCGRASICIDIVRVPSLKWDTKRTDLNSLLLQIGKDCIALCEKIGCSRLIVQPLFSGIEKSDLWTENRKYYMELGESAKEKNICILMENQCSNINGHFYRGVCADVSVASEWIDSLNEELQHDTFGFCLDTGAANLCGQNMGEMAIALGERLKSVRIRDCDGVKEASRLPFTGMNENGDSTDWLSMIRGFREINFNGTLIMDAGNTLRGFSHLLRPQLYPLVKSVADFFSWQITMEKCLKRYSTRVLFGAGKMCQNYMECYGEEYPPLFICDNNADLWGTVCCGLEVRSPESLKELPDSCAVIICNVYYKEIAKQLKEMGIKNIEAFNDEYLPVLHEKS